MTETRLAPPPAMDRRIVRVRRPRWLRWLGVALGVAALAALVAWLLPARDALVVDASAIDSAAVVRAPFQDYLPLRAEVAPLTSVVVSATSGGTVAVRDAADGALVTARQPLAHLANPTLRLEVASREAEIAARLGDLAAQELALRRGNAEVGDGIAAANNELLRAEHDLAQRETLYAKGIVALANVEPYRREVAFRRERLAALQHNRGGENAAAGTEAARLTETGTLLRVSLAQVRAGLDTLVLRAPVGGRLTAFTLQPGQTLRPGDPIGQIDSEGAYKLVGDVDEFYLARLTPGQSASVDIDGTAARLTVAKVLPQVVNGRFRVELAFAGVAPALRRGQSVDARIALGATRSAIVAPAGTWLDAGGTTAFVLDAEGAHAMRRAIAVGRRTPMQVEILSGLEPGERIVTSGIVAFKAQNSLILRQGSQS